MRALDEYLVLLDQMPVNKNDGEPAPHKAVLLLAVIDSIERGMIDYPFIPVTDDLINTFNKIWKRVVPDSSRFSRKFSYPFYHLDSSPFWNLVKASTYVGQKEYSSVSSLRRDFLGAAIDVELFQYLVVPESRDKIRNFLSKRYLAGDASSSAGKVGLLALLAVLVGVA